MINTTEVQNMKPSGFVKPQKMKEAEKKESYHREKLVTMLSWMAKTRKPPPELSADLGQLNYVEQDAHDGKHG